MIFFLFKPLNIKQQTFTDVPLFKLSDFTLYELNQEGLTTLMTGTHATRYSNRYVVSNINYTDNSKDFIANMKAKDGLYKDKTVDLSGGVVYHREDGLVFKTQKITYNKETTILKANQKFVMYRGDDTMTGSSIVYNNKLNKVRATNIEAQYKLQEKEL